MKVNVLFLELTGLDGKQIYVNGQLISGVIQKENYSCVYMNSDNIPFKVQEDAEYIMDLLIKAARTFE